jgi:hypothetical protein
MPQQRQKLAGSDEGTLPEDLDFDIPWTATLSVTQGIKNCQNAGDSLILVVLVVYLAP